MKVGKYVLTIGVVAITAYTAGRLDLPFDGSNVAVAQQGDHPEHPGMSPEMQKQMEEWAKLGAPSEHHRILEALAGSWDGTFSFKMDPESEMMTSNGLVTREWVLGNRYLQEKVDAEGFGPDRYNAIGYIGYNNIDNQYEMVWMDNMSTAIMMEKGRYDPATKKMHFKGKHKDPTGKEFATRSEVDLSNPNKHTFTGWTTMDGKEFKSMEGSTEKQ